MCVLSVCVAFQNFINMVCCQNHILVSSSKGKSFFKTGRWWQNEIGKVLVEYKASEWLRAITKETLRFFNKTKHKMDLLGSILGTMEKPPSMSDSDKKKIKG